ncbi:MAG: CoA pyrophosphatase [Deltaproteobacteria bacterium]|nr:CoA pyrophosphatase [Deltaproteobacteria bacterium]
MLGRAIEQPAATTEDALRSALTAHDRRVLPLDDFLPASVLIPVLADGGRPRVLLTVRTDRVEHHKNQISFPGGRQDEGEDLERTALREAHEEVGLPPDRVRVVGMLDDIYTVTSYRVTPFVGWVDRAVRFAPSPPRDGGDSRYSGGRPAEPAHPPQRGRAMAGPRRHAAFLPLERLHDLGCDGNDPEPVSRGLERNGRMKRAAVWTAALLLFAAGGCVKKTVETAEPEPAPPEFVDDIREEDVIEASVGDTVTVQLTVYSSKNLSLDRENPVEVYAPAESPFEFNERVYRFKKRPWFFPLDVTFAVADPMPPGVYTIKLPVRMYFASQADGEKQTRVELTDVKVRIVERLTATPHEVKFPMEYMLE